MRTRTIRLFAVATFALAGLGVTTAPAAAGTGTVSGAGITSSADLTAQAARRSWNYHSTHDTKQQCREEGERLEELGLIRSYSCTQKQGRYELYVDWTE